MQRIPRLSEDRGAHFGRRVCFFITCTNDATTSCPGLLELPFPRKRVPSYCEINIYWSYIKVYIEAQQLLWDWEWIPSRRPPFPSRSLWLFSFRTRLDCFKPSYRLIAKLYFQLGCRCREATTQGRRFAVDAAELGQSRSVLLSTLGAGPRCREGSSR